MKIECECGNTLPGIMAGQSLTCGCGVTYAATVSVEALQRRQRELAADVQRLAQTMATLSLLVRER